MDANKAAPLVLIPARIPYGKAAELKSFNQQQKPGLFGKTGLLKCQTVRSFP
jgi:hypothetical protein